LVTTASTYGSSSVYGMNLATRAARWSWAAAKTPGRGIPAGQGQRRNADVDDQRSRPRLVQQQRNGPEEWLVQEDHVGRPVSSQQTA
jgi:hypothetical protein